MAMNKRGYISFSRLLASLGAALAVFAALPVASGQQQTGSGLSISPTRQELTIEAGKADVIHITLKNTANADVTAKAVVNDFESDNVTGEPKILVNAKSDAPTSIKSFLVGLNDVELKKGESKNFDVPVQITKGTTSGVYYGVIRYTAVPKNPESPEGRQVALNASLGLIVLIQVPGNITERLQAVKLSVDRNDRNGSFFIAPPQHANVTVKNTGNGFTKPFGRVAVTDMQGKQVYSYEMNGTDPRANVLPNSSRVFKDDIKSVNKLGRYTVTANVSYGRGGDILTLKTSFWVLPLWFVIIIAVLFLALLTAGILLYRRLSKKYRRHNR